MPSYLCWLVMLGVHYDDGSGDDSLIAMKFKVLTRRKQFIFVGLGMVPVGIQERQQHGPHLLL